MLLAGKRKTTVRSGQFSKTSSSGHFPKKSKFLKKYGQQMSADTFFGSITYKNQEKPCLAFESTKR